MNNPEVTQQALNILRNGENFQWYLLMGLAFVVYVYTTEMKNNNWKVVAAGFSYYMVHWFVEIVNGLIQHFSGHALWTVPSGTSFLLLIGVGAELSLMFMVSGLALSKLLPDDPKMKIFGINNRLLYIVGNAAFYSVFEIFLVRTPAFAWVYSWWGAFPVFVSVYIPFFAISVWCHDTQPAMQRIAILSMLIINVSMLTIFAGFLKWI